MKLFHQDGDGYSKAAGSAGGLLHVLNPEMKHIGPSREPLPEGEDDTGFSYRGALKKLFSLPYQVSAQTL